MSSMNLVVLVFSFVIIDVLLLLLFLRRKELVEGVMGLG